MMYSKQYIIDELLNAKGMIEEALDFIESGEDNETSPSIIATDALNELIGLGLVPDAIIQISETGFHYRFVGYVSDLDGSGLLACFRALDENDAAPKDRDIKSELEKLVEKKDSWRLVKNEPQDKGGEA